ncbi:MAG: hypothetical protein AB9842_07970 [Bacteroidales bacterium]
MEETVTIQVSQENDSLLIRVDEGESQAITVNVANEENTVLVNLADPEVPQVTINVSEGKDGLSAYQLWLQQGNQGSLEDFLNSGSDKYFRFTQHLPAISWTIEHNLNKRPSVTVTDTAGTVVIGSIEYLNNNSLVITFSAAFSGYAELN